MDPMPLLTELRTERNGLYYKYFTPNGATPSQDFQKLRCAIPFAPPKIAIVFVPARGLNSWPLLAVMDTQYKIIGGDGAEYGPAPLDELKSWIRDGRVAAMTKVWRSDLSAWSPANRYSELRGELATLHAAADRALPPAGFWARLAAYIIDLIVLTVISLAIWTPIASWQH